MKFKRALSLVLSVLTVLSVMTVFTMSPAAYDRTALKRYLSDAFSNCTAEIDVSSYHVSDDDLYQIVFLEVPEHFCFGEYGYLTDGTYVTKIRPKYTMTADKCRDVVSKCNSAAQFLLRDLAGSHLSDVEKALVVHDRLAAWCQPRYNETVSPVDYTIEGSLVNRHSVCDGYADAYIFLLSKLGIECIKCSSDALRHSWNIVTINGKKYYVDVTWDDKAYDVYGRVYHENFMLSYSALKSNHTASDFDTSPSDTTYENYFWKKSIAEIQYCDGKLWWFNNFDNNLYKYTSGKSEKVLTVSDKWSNYVMTINDMKCTNATALASDSGNLYYSDAKHIYKLNGNSGEAVYNESSSLNIIGFTIVYGNFYIDRSATISSTPTSRNNAVTAPVPGSTSTGGSTTGGSTAGGSTTGGSTTGGSSTGGSSSGGTGSGGEQPPVQPVNPGDPTPPSQSDNPSGGNGIADTITGIINTIMSFIQMIIAAISSLVQTISSML